jgi:hypothetical protein
MTQSIAHRRLRIQYFEVRDAILTLKGRYETRKSEKAELERQLAAFRKLVTKQCILIKAGRQEISRLAEIIAKYQEWGDEDSGIGSS